MIIDAVTLDINLGNPTIYADPHHLKPQRKMYSRYCIPLVTNFNKGLCSFTTPASTTGKKKSFFLYSKRKRGVVNIKIIWKCPRNEFFINDYLVTNVK